jgi:hypothetical protein
MFPSITSTGKHEFIQIPENLYKSENQALSKIYFSTGYQKTYDIICKKKFEES